MVNTILIQRITCDLDIKPPKKQTKEITILKHFFCAKSAMQFNFIGN